MKRTQTPAGNQCWDYITTFSIYSNYTYNVDNLAHQLKERVIGVYFRSAIKIAKGMDAGTYHVTFSYNRDTDANKWAQTLLDNLIDIEREVEVALKIDTMKGLLDG